jgi:hypothetical protein
MATTVSATNDIKADVRELADIAIEDKFLSIRLETMVVMLK